MSKEKDFIWKSADTGKIVSEEYALANPKECYKHNIEDDKSEEE